ncbi:hypothetical protein ACNKHX_09690 [Shigella flexneri]
MCGLINAGLIIYTKVNPLVITLGTLYLFAGALCCFPVWPSDGYEGIRGFPWRLQISLTLMCWDSRSADYLPDMLPFSGLAA